MVGGGAESMLAGMVTASPRPADEIMIVSLVPGDSYAERLQNAGITVVQLDFAGMIGIASGLYRLAKLIRDFEPDIVQGWMYHGDLAALIGLALSGRRRRTRLIWSIRCSDMDLSRYGLGFRLVVKACALLSRRPDLITANSAAGLKTHLRLGYRPRRTEVIANGIAIEEFKPDPAARAAVRRELGISGDAIVIIHVARTDPMKDHATFLAAMEQLPELVALLVIPNNEHDLPAERNLFRIGRRRDMTRIFAAADFVVSSSRYGEGFSNVLAEGMACGLPAVATDVGDAKLIVGDSGLIVPPQNPDALAAAIGMLASEQAAARAERAAKARARIVECFPMSRAVQRYVQVYASLPSPQQ
jgi:glycosyltransferase involved in cell wall biosynthesis